MPQEFPSVAAPPGGGSAAEATVAALRTAILNGALEPGAPLRQDALARHFGTSHIPVREALRQLVSEGLAVARPRCGVRVAPMTAAEAEELTELRALLEGHLLASAFEQLDGATLDAAAGTLGHLDTTKDLDRLLILHAAFHERLYAAAGRPKALDMVRNLRAGFERYLRHVWRHTDYRAQSSEEHWLLLDHCRRGDRAAALALLDRHIRATGATVVGVLGADAPVSRKTVS